MRQGNRLVAFGITFLLAASCGGGSSGGGRDGASGPNGLSLRVFDVGAMDPVRLDQMIMFVFDGPVSSKKIGPETIRIRSGNETAEGTWFRGIVLADERTGAPYVIDPDEIGAERLDEIETKGQRDLVPNEIRYDLGARSRLNGDRRVLSDRSIRRAVCFQPRIPVLADLSDAGLKPGRTYTVEIAGHRRVRTFRTVAADDAQLFVGMENAQRPTVVVNTDPTDAQQSVPPDPRIRIRFSQPLDPRTVSAENIRLRLVSVAGQPEIPVDVALDQTFFGRVEVVLSPQRSLPAGWYEVSIATGVTDLVGVRIPPDSKVSFATDQELDPLPILESFETDTMEDADAGTADWNVTSGELVAAAGLTESVGQSFWYDQFFPTPDYDEPVVDRELNGGTIEIELQGARENVLLPGSQPVDPETDPERLFTTDWVPIAEYDRLDNYQHLRFRVTFRPAAGNPLPTVKAIFIPVD